MPIATQVIQLEVPDEALDATVCMEILERFGDDAINAEEMDEKVRDSFDARVGHVMSCHGSPN